MKRLAIIISVLPLFLSACIERPEAGFIASDIVVEVGEPVYFTNNSFDAVSFEWDFGDGSFTNELNPIHYYDASGIFSITLSAWSKNDYKVLSAIETKKSLVKTENSPQQNNT